MCSIAKYSQFICIYSIFSYTYITYHHLHIYLLLTNVEHIFTYLNKLFIHSVTYISECQLNYTESNRIRG
ncbi:hypothetical protein F383_23377 [Gossypium arboreum]|uniref:Uncharacterized protein n=1 Tax=Gossypium arboreum TaxID=29729 RepID=A0A0B0P1X2_GOSAR|nr:hypothetical protein F383_23377 [Gossypium arboreum]